MNGPFSLKTPALEFLAVQAKKYPKIQRLILFGSRGRGDAQERSDYDIAVDAPEMSDVEWSQCASFFRENIPTLCGLDLVRIQPKMALELRRHIQEEGKVFYVRESK